MSRRPGRRSSPAPCPPGLNLDVDIVVCQAGRAGLTLGVRDGFSQRIPNPAAFQQFTKVAAERFPTRRALQSSRNLGVDWDCHIDRLFHPALSSKRNIAILAELCTPRAV